MGASEWAVRRLGDAADALLDAVVAAIAEAHGDAVAAQVASGTPKRDPYGHTMKNRQHECLVARVRNGDVPGAEVVRPRGASFELVQIPATNAILFPWRYATDGQLRREDARMRTSTVRRGLLAGVVDGRGQLSLDHAGVQDEELEAQLAEEEAVAAELRSFARVVTIGYASNPTGILDLGWGDAELLDDDGRVDWDHWEPLIAELRSSAPGGFRQLNGSSVKPRSIPDLATATPRFDAAPLDDDFGLQPRSPLAGEPESEAGPAAGETGTEGDRR